MELWGGEILEAVASQFGHVLKVDPHTIDHSRVKFAWVCVELDLNKPLLQGTWVQCNIHSVFVLALYEKILVYCFRCGRVGHGEAHCSFASNPQCPDVSVPSMSLDAELVHCASMMRVDGANEEQPGAVNPSLTSPQNNDIVGEFRSWLKPRSCQNSVRGRSGGHGGSRASNTGGRQREDEPNPNACPLHGSPLPCNRHMADSLPVEDTHILSQNLRITRLSIPRAMHPLLQKS